MQMDKAKSAMKIKTSKGRGWKILFMACLLAAALMGLSGCTNNPSPEPAAKDNMQNDMMKDDSMAGSSMKDDMMKDNSMKGDGMNDDMMKDDGMKGDSMKGDMMKDDGMKGSKM